MAATKKESKPIKIGRVYFWAQQPKLTTYPLEEQATEIEYRLADVLADALTNRHCLTKAHLIASLGIDDNTYNRWINCQTRHKVGGVERSTSLELAKYGEDEKEAITKRGDCLKKYTGLFMVECSDYANTAFQAGAPIFTLKTSYGLRETDNSSAPTFIVLDDVLKNAKQRIAQKNALPINDDKQGENSATSDNVH